MREAVSCGFLPRHRSSAALSMFAKRQSALAAAAGAPPEARSRVGVDTVLAALRRPPVAVGAAGVFLLAAGLLFVAVLGDPRAGAPSARVSLQRPTVAETAPTGADAFAMSGLDLYQDMAGGDPALLNL